MEQGIVYLFGRPIMVSLQISEENEIEFLNEINNIQRGIELFQSYRKINPTPQDLNSGKPGILFILLFAKHFFAKFIN